MAESEFHSPSLELFSLCDLLVLCDFGIEETWVDVFSLFPIPLPLSFPSSFVFTEKLQGCTVVPHTHSGFPPCLISVTSYPIRVHLLEPRN